jgi:hypothetical protein
MTNIIEFFSNLIFVFCVLSTIQLSLNFIRAVFSDPPKPFTLTKTENILYGVVFSYIITYLIHLI